MDWQGLFLFAKKQAILGVVFEGVKRMEEDEGRIPYHVLMEWITITAQIEYQNKVVNAAAAEVTKKLKDRGFDSCVLKGQGNALMYPNHYSRMSGDIDVWVKRNLGTAGCGNGGIKEVIKFVKGVYPKARAIYYHIDACEINGVEVEVHYKPSFMNNPIYNSRLQRWFAAHNEEQYTNIVELPDGVGEVAVPATEFNIVFQLSHIYNHLLQEGIGLRQIIDYYYVLKSKTNHTNDTNIIDLLNYLGLIKIAGAVMWVLNEVLGLEENYLIVPKNEQIGKVLLSEIIRGGNFGYYDENNRKATTAIKKNVQRLKRDFRMMRYFPSECLWEPIFRVYHYFWRLRYN